MKAVYNYNGEVLDVLFIDFVNDEFCILPESELEGGSQLVIKDVSKITWETTNKNDLELEVDSLKNKIEFVLQNFVSKTNISYVRAMLNEQNNKCTVQDIITIAKKHHIFAEELHKAMGGEE